MLRIYVSADCPSCPTARRRFAQVRVACPALPAQLVDVDTPGAPVPPHIIGTPIYTWGDRIIFRGNPGERELIARLRALQEADRGPGAGEARLPHRG